ncbi:MAG: hypothetical protein H0V48_09945 [Nocardioidaceae bacterium]|nr:hypothetical protein [Nocardioidaceae bacterium]MDQ3164911.1 DUF5703 family protein [Actinomycetota bacterium]
MDYEFQRFWLPRSSSRTTVRRLLTDAAEYGGWELDRLRLLPDGRRRVILRRRIIRAVRTW